jgi:hypothetical protein
MGFAVETRVAGSHARLDANGRFAPMQPLFAVNRHIAEAFARFSFRGG